MQGTFFGAHWGEGDTIAREPAVMVTYADKCARSDQAECADPYQTFS